MKRIIAILSCAACVLLSLAAFASPKLGLIYEVKMKSVLGDMGTRKMYIKGDYFKFEANSAGLSTKVIKNNSGTYLIDHKGKTAGKYPNGSNREKPTVYVPGPAGDVQSFLKTNNAKSIGSGTVESKKCKGYTYTETETKLPCKLWIDEKTGYPVRLVYEQKIQQTGQTQSVTITYTSYKPNSEIKDSMFELPAGIKVIEMSKPRVPAGTSKASEKK